MILFLVLDYRNRTAKRNDQRSLLVFRLQAKGSVLLLSAETNDDSNVCPCSERALSGDFSV